MEKESLKEEPFVPTMPAEPDVPICSTQVRSADHVLDQMRPRRLQLFSAVFICSLSWAFGAVILMSSAFNSIDCGSCNGTMLTIVSEFNLREEDAYLVGWSTSVFMFGNMLGGSVFTHAGDRYGRRPVLMGCMLGQAISAAICSLSNSILNYSICRLLQGACYTGANLVAWVTAYELCPSRLRSLVTLAFGLTWVVGYSLVAPMAFFSPNWRFFSASIIAPLLIYTLFCYLIVPETLHFLVSKRKTKRAHKWIERFDNELVDRIDVLQLISTSSSSEKSDSGEKGSFSQEMCKHKKFIGYCLVQLFIWTTDNFVYFGLSLYSTQLNGNVYVNYVLMGIVELPAYIFCPILLERFGRKIVVSGAHLLAGFCFCASIFMPDHDWISLTCWLIGKFAISCSFMSLFVYASEIFPTNIRNVSVGLCSVLSRLGSISAPYIGVLGAISPILPMIVLTVLSVTAGLLTFLLPETRHKPLPDTI